MKMNGKENVTLYLVSHPDSIPLWVYLRVCVGTNIVLSPEL